MTTPRRSPDDRTAPRRPDTFAGLLNPARCTLRYLTVDDNGRRHPTDLDGPAPEQSR